MKPALPAAILIAAMLCPVSQAEDAATWRIVNFWSEWCAPCRKEIPMLNALSRSLEPLGISVVGVNFDEDPRAVTLEIAARLGIAFPTLTGDEVAALNLRPPEAMPTTVILTPANDVAARLVGLQDEEAIMTQLARLGLPIAATSSRQP
ncbi:TlpA family protein disulfide reductase [Chromatocurvus halotolerans]|uniref:Thiol-disulfide isomerase/thioredoxin n=1 Tax=Chromatocurvus halotolerans TaxID=1132028 RepID=A0A4R2KQ51_9GAMM|nr:TlpA disulfide reductase family protein [Chromatocurvus halotolerans]TCO72238.1 thiol-disulfide isomerase/thioredoxin [Chromatocurvus halotolerans]